MSLRAISFVRHTGAFGAGHVGWAFEYESGKFNCGSVENNGGTPVAAVVNMDFWTCDTYDPAGHMRERRYDAFQVVEVVEPNPQVARDTVAWISHQPYLVLGRNCLDDVYDVLRAYGVPDLPLPRHEMIPNRWFELLPGDPQKLTEEVSIPLSAAATGRGQEASYADDECDIAETEPGTAPSWRVHGSHHQRNLLERLLGEHRGTPVIDQPDDA